MKNKNNYNLKNYFYFLLNMSSFTNSRVGKRGKGVFKRNKNSNVNDFLIMVINLKSL